MLGAMIASFFQSIGNILWKNPNEPFGQPSKIGHPLFSQVTDTEEISSHFKIKYSIHQEDIKPQSVYVQVRQLQNIRMKSEKYIE